MRTVMLLAVLAAAVSASVLPPLGQFVANVDIFDLEDDMNATDSSTNDPIISDSTTGSSMITISSLATDDGSSGTSLETTLDYNSTDTDFTEETSDTPGTSTFSPDDGNGDDDEGLSGGAIAGIVIGSIAGVALIGGLIYYLKIKELLCFG